MKEMSWVTRVHLSIKEAKEIIHLVTFQGIKQIANLSNDRQLTLKFFPLSCQKYYILSG